jgi:hypothetical protein
MYRIGSACYEIDDRLVLRQSREVENLNEHPPKKSPSGKDMVWNEETKRYRLATKQSGDQGGKQKQAQRAIT